jgi:prefoldin subunit 5
MKNIVEVLKQKERDLENLQREIETVQREMEALRTAMRLCAENDSELALIDSRPLRMPVRNDGAAPKQVMQTFP